MQIPVNGNFAVSKIFLFKTIRGSKSHLPFRINLPIDAGNKVVNSVILIIVREVERIPLFPPGKT